MSRRVPPWLRDITGSIHAPRRRIVLQVIIDADGWPEVCKRLGEAARAATIAELRREDAPSYAVEGARSGLWVRGIVEPTE